MEYLKCHIIAPDYLNDSEVELYNTLVLRGLKYATTDDISWKEHFQTTIIPLVELLSDEDATEYLDGMINEMKNELKRRNNK